MASLTSRPVGAKWWQTRRADIKGGIVTVASRIDPKTREPVSYWIGVTNGQTGTRSYDIELTPDEWRHFLSSARSIA